LVLTYFYWTWHFLNYMNTFYKQRKNDNMHLLSYHKNNIRRIYNNSYQHVVPLCISQYDITMNINDVTMKSVPRHTCLYSSFIQFLEKNKCKVFVFLFFFFPFLFSVNGKI
jgi:hypothetical protein